MKCYNIYFNIIKQFGLNAHMQKRCTKSFLGHENIYVSAFYFQELKCIPITVAFVSPSSRSHWTYTIVPRKSYVDHRRVYARLVPLAIARSVGRPIRNVSNPATFIEHRWNPLDPRARLLPLIPSRCEPNARGWRGSLKMIGTRPIREASTALSTPLNALALRSCPLLASLTPKPPDEERERKNRARDLSIYYPTLRRMRERREGLDARFRDFNRR